MNSLIASDTTSDNGALAPMAEREALIRLDQVAVEYRAPRERIRTFKEYAIRLLKGGVKHEEFRALSDVSFEVRRGEVFGVIGRNGAGKSTLLKVVSRVLKPTRGRVWVKGRMAPLLELGAGFHPELSGRENIYLNGTLLGYTRAEVDALFDEIVDFADLWDFIDAPLRTYSTGMGVRLGFSVATASRPDILLVDEVLSVGDERFQEKCAARMTEFRQAGMTILLVTHDTRLVLNMCDRAVWLNQGEVGVLGAVDEVVEAYHNANMESASRRRSRSGASSAKSARSAKSGKEDKLDAKQAHPLENLVLERQWFYRFDLPSGAQTDSLFSPEVALIHDTRWRMLQNSLNILCKGDWSQLRCLDVGCNQGYFALQLARQGCRQVVGLDARAVHISDADLIRRIWGLENLQFRHLDWLKLSAKDLPPSDVVLLNGLLYQLENPIGALRLAHQLAKKAVVVETQLAPELDGEMDWGAADNKIEIQGSFVLLDRSADVETPFGSLTPFSLCPGRQTLVWLMQRLGFKRVEIVPPPPGAYEQFQSGKRVMVIGYV
ncbi:MAG: ATP-binding cassette domain-containing protein [Acidobacteria bacterium]|nr:ATP-binding cassette domain-containing protein [Acidobacteriota bacterium]